MDPSKSEYKTIGNISEILEFYHTRVDLWTVKIFNFDHWTVKMQCLDQSGLDQPEIFGIDSSTIDCSGLFNFGGAALFTVICTNSLSDMKSV